MVAPIKGPTIYSTPIANISFGSGSTYERKEKYGQKRPYNLPLPYRKDYQTVVVETATGTYLPSFPNKSGADVSWRSAPRIGGSNADNLASNRALSKFQEKAGDPSLWMANLIQCQQSLDMISERALQGVRLIRAVRRRDVGGLMATLREIAGDSVKLPPHVQASRLKRAGSALSNTSLEVLFGWRPLISDVSQACEVLSKDFGTFPASGSGQAVDSSSRTWTVAPYDYWEESWLYRVRTKVGAKVRINNPNLYLANQLGLVNPFTTAWEVAPWSFVVDYVLNVGQFLDGLTPYLGLSLQDLYSRSSSVGYRFTSTRSTWGTGGSESCGYLAKDTRGATSLPPVRLAFRELTMKPLRAITSWSLLIQQVNRRSL